MSNEEIIFEVHRVMEVQFVQQSLFELLTDYKQPFTRLLVVNHQNRFLSLSNEKYYIFLQPITSNNIIAEVKERSNYIFNRRILFVQLNNQISNLKSEDHFSLSALDIIKQAERNGIPEKNLFLRLLQDAISPTINTKI